MQDGDTVESFGLISDVQVCATIAIRSACHMLSRIIIGIAVLILSVHADLYAAEHADKLKSMINASECIAIVSQGNIERVLLGSVDKLKNLANLNIGNKVKEIVFIYRDDKGMEQLRAFPVIEETVFLRNMGADGGVLEINIDKLIQHIAKQAGQDVVE